jgi:hypothetical protein
MQELFYTFLVELENGDALIEYSFAYFGILFQKVQIVLASKLY